MNRCLALVATRDFARGTSRGSRPAAERRRASRAQPGSTSAGAVDGAESSGVDMSWRGGVVASISSVTVPTVPSVRHSLGTTQCSAFEEPRLYLESGRRKSSTSVASSRSPMAQTAPGTCGSLSRLSNHTLVHRRFDRITGARLRDGDRQGSVGLVDVVPRDLRISDSEGDGVVTGLLRGS